MEGHSSVAILLMPNTMGSRMSRDSDAIFEMNDLQEQQQRLRLIAIMTSGLAPSSHKAIITLQTTQNIAHQTYKLLRQHCTGIAWVSNCS